MLKEYIGGYGLGARILSELHKAPFEALGPENVLGILAGPLTGTRLPFVSRYTVVGKSPLTGTWGDANGSGFFGPALRRSGFDGVFLQGAAERPVYLLVQNGQAELVDASDTWGLDTYATEETIKGRYGKTAEIACIGPSGEQLSLLAGVVTAKGRIAARSGLGAVFGSKKLKGLIALGSLPVPVARPEEVENLRRKYIGQMKAGVGFAPMYSTTGTPGYIEPGALVGDSPVRNWYGSAARYFSSLRELSYDNVAKYMTGKKTCYLCPMACWAHVKVENGPYATDGETHRPEYESAAAFGSYCLNNNFESIIRCNDICNRYGIDTISTGACVAFAMSCFEEGLLTVKDTDGLELNWGNHQAIVALTEKIAKQEGVGRLLANGVKIASQLIGKASERFAIHVGGQELPAHDPRYEPSLASIYRNNATPGRHTQGSQYCVPPKLAELLPQVDFSHSFGANREVQTGRSKAQRVLTTLFHSMSSAGMCLFGYLSTEVTYLPESLSAVTGRETDLQELIQIGERIANVRLAYTRRQGINPFRLRFPPVALGNPPLADGPTQGISIDLDLLTIEYCQEMGWDPQTGLASADKLKQLNCEFLLH